MPATSWRPRSGSTGILAKHTGQTVERIKQDSDRDNFMTAEMARAYGLVDSMLEKRGELPAKGHLMTEEGRNSAT